VLQGKCTRGDEHREHVTLYGRIIWKLLTHMLAWVNAAASAEWSCVFIAYKRAVTLVGLLLLSSVRAPISQCCVVSCRSFSEEHAEATSNAAFGGIHRLTTPACECGCFVLALVWASWQCNACCVCYMLLQNRCASCDADCVTHAHAMLQVSTAHVSRQTCPDTVVPNMHCVRVQQCVET
jgi:hypothetical protein